MKCVLTALTVLTLLASGCGGDPETASDADRIRPVETTATSTISSTSKTISSTTTVELSPTTRPVDPTSTTTTAATQGISSRPTAPLATGYVDEGASAELEAELIGIVSDVRDVATRAALTLELADSTLDRLMTPHLSQRYRDLVNDWKQSGEIGRLPAESISGSTFALIFVDGDLAVLQECVTDDIVVTIAKTDEVVDASVGRRVNEWTLRRTSAGWKASDQTTVLDGQDALDSDRCDF